MRACTRPRSRYSRFDARMKIDVTTSPAFRNSLRARPTPAGVPVRIRSPGRSVRRVERWEICSASVKIILLVWESCLIVSLTHSLMATFCGSAMASAGTIHGPSGTGILEAFLAEPVVLERRGVGHVRPFGEVARGEIVGDGIARDMSRAHSRSRRSGRVGRSPPSTRLPSPPSWNRPGASPCCRAPQGNAWP